MASLKGIFILGLSIIVAIIELYYIIIEPFMNGVNIQATPSQYWSVAIPVFVITFVIALTSAWIAYTMITTPEPIKLTYEEAYEVAAEQTNQEPQQ